jgi:hypothetical protein
MERHLGIVRSENTRPVILFKYISLRRLYAFAVNNIKGSFKCVILSPLPNPRVVFNLYRGKNEQGAGRL